MIDINSLGKYQQHLLDINSANYKYELLENCKNYIDGLVKNGEFDFLVISEDVDNIYKTNNYFYDYLENKLTYTVKVKNQEYYEGYNQLNIEALLYGIYTPDPNFVIHDEMYANLDNIYNNFFSNISEHSIYSIFYNNFKINTLNPSNYLKVCFNKEDRNLNYKIANFYISPIYDFSKICTPQILTSIKKQLYHTVLDKLPNSLLQITDTGDLNDELSEFILKNIFNDFDFNSSYKIQLSQSIDVNELSIVFNNFINTLPSHNILNCINNIYYDFNQEFAYILMTIGRERGLVTFNTPESIYTNSIFALNEVLYKEDPIINDLLNLKERPSIFYLYKTSPTDEGVYLLRFENVDYKITKKHTPNTFATLTNILISTDINNGYINILKNKFVDSYESGIFMKTGHTKSELEELVKNANLVKLSTQQNIVPKNSIYKTLINDILKRVDDMKSVITLTYKYRNEPLQFINSNLASFSDWLDLILETQYNNSEYIDVLNDGDINNIITSIQFKKTSNINDPDKYEYDLVNFINSNFIDLFKNSKVIELNVYRYLGELVDKFIKTQTFKDYILFKFIEPIAISLKTRSPKLYKEIYQNIDNVINYIKYLLILKLYNSSELTSKYRDILNTPYINHQGELETLKIDNFTNEVFENFVNDFYKLDSAIIDKYKKESVKFTTSMAMLFLLDKYIDGFRLLKKYQSYNIERVVYDEYHSLVTVYLDDIHNLELGRGVTIIGNPGNINGYKIVYSPDDRGTRHFTFYQPNAKVGQGGTINIKRELSQTYIIKTLSYDETIKVVTIYLDRSHNLGLDCEFSIDGNSGNINGYKLNTSNNEGTYRLTFYQPNATLGEGGFVTISPH